MKQDWGLILHLNHRLRTLTEQKEVQCSRKGWSCEMKCFLEHHYLKGSWQVSQGMPAGASDRCFLKTEVRARSRPEPSN